MYVQGVLLVLVLYRLLPTEVTVMFNFSVILPISDNF